MRKRRRRLLDLTPLLDVIMILLFGTMINSVELARVAQKGGPTAAQAEDKLAADRKAFEDEVRQFESRRSDLTRRSQVERAALLRSLAAMAGISKQDLAAFDRELNQLARLPGDQIDHQVEAIKKRIEGEQLARAVARLREMQKIFSFVDLHVDAKNFLTVRFDGEMIERLSVLDRPAGEIESDLRRLIEPLRFSEVVLVLFSYDGDARDRAVEASERAINELLDRLRSDQSQRGRQFRLGRVGMVQGMDPAGEE